MMNNFFMVAILLAALIPGCGDGKKATEPVAGKATEFRISENKVSGFSGMDEVWSYSVDGIISSYVTTKIDGDSVLIVGIGNSSIHTDSGRIIGLVIEAGNVAFEMDLNRMSRPAFVTFFDNFRVDAMDINDGVLVVAASDVRYYASMVKIINIVNGGRSGEVFWNPGTLQYLSMYVVDGRRKVVAAGFNNDIARYLDVGKGPLAKPAAVFFQLDVEDMLPESQAPPSLMSDAIHTGSEWYYAVPETEILSLSTEGWEENGIRVEVKCEKSGEEVRSLDPPQSFACMVSLRPDGSFMYPPSPDMEVYKISGYRR